MRHTLLLVAISAALLFQLSVSAHTGNESAQTKTALQVPNEYNWGTLRMPPDQKLYAELIITNGASDGTMRIVEVKPGCGCTRTDPDKWELKPGETSTVKITLNLSPSQSGAVLKSLMVTTVHNSDTLKKSVLLRADVQRALAIGPSMYVAMNDLIVDKESVATLTFENTSDNTVNLTNIQVPELFASNINDAQTIAPHSKREISVRCTPTKNGQVSGSLRFTASGNGEAEEFLIPIYGTVSDALQVGNLPIQSGQTK